MGYAAKDGKEGEGARPPFGSVRGTCTPSSMIAFYENEVALLVIGKEGGYEKEGVAAPVSSIVSGETLYSLCLVLFPPVLQPLQPFCVGRPSFMLSRLFSTALPNYQACTAVRVISTPSSQWPSFLIGTHVRHFCAGTHFTSDKGP